MVAHGGSSVFACVLLLLSFVACEQNCLKDTDKSSDPENKLGDVFILFFFSF